MLDSPNPFYDKQDRFVDSFSTPSTYNDISRKLNNLLKLTKSVKDKTS